MASLLDVAFSLRILRKHWKLASIAVFSLAIAMAVAVLGLSIANALLLRPPAVPTPSRLMAISSDTPRDLNQGFSYPDYVYYRDHNSSFTDIAAFPESISFNPLSIDDHTITALTNPVSDNFFSALGLQPFLGRFFSRGDDDAATLDAVLSYAFWQKLGSDRNIIGKTITRNSFQLTVIGVAPRGFNGIIFSVATSVWYPLSSSAKMEHQPDTWRTDRATGQHISLVGRLKPGVSQPQAAADLRLLSSQLATAYPETYRDHIAVVGTFSMLPPDAVYGGRIISAILLAVVALVLFAACSNVANLLLALANVRRQEILIRSALGATRFRLAQQLLIDSAFLATGGGVFGYLLTWYALRRLTHYQPFFPGFGRIPIVLDFHPDLTVVALTAFVVFAVAFFTGLVPGLYASTPNLAGALSGELAVGGTRKHRLRSALVAIQVGVCTLVLIGVGLCVRSLRAMSHVNLGFAARNIATIDVGLDASVYTEERGRAIYTQIRQAFLQVHGVESVSVASTFPLQSGDGDLQRVQLEGAAPDDQHTEEVLHGVADGNYFATLQVPLLAGASFSDRESPKDPLVVIINQMMAKKFWPNQNPVGQKIRILDAKKVATVIGVVGDVKQTDLDEANKPFMYYSLSQQYQPSSQVIVRTQGKPDQWFTPLYDAIHNLDPNLGFLFMTLDNWVDLSLYVAWVTLVCAGAIGSLAAVLAAVGLYGAVFYSVSERRREFGIRTALGAHPADLWRMILRQTGQLTAIGVAAGLAAGIGATAVIRTMLFGVQPIEWLVLFAVASAMAAMTAASAYSAARPWLRADPMEAVRHT
ncbi:MAG TPA: ADOP family duplicated permease [Candidatus Acidoferrales bacterium]|nr:ADOP family duplicated permease [Candidatus Acidoferrales bacterium]